MRRHLTYNMNYKMFLRLFRTTENYYTFLMKGVSTTMALNFCPYCGTKLVTGAQFCFQCGKKIQLTEMEVSSASGSTLDSAQGEPLQSEHIENSAVIAEKKLRKGSVSTTDKVLEYFFLGRTLLLDITAIRFNELKKEYQKFAGSIRQSFTEEYQAQVSNWDSLVNNGMDTFENHIQKCFLFSASILHHFGLPQYRARDIEILADPKIHNDIVNYYTERNNHLYYLAEQMDKELAVRKGSHSHWSGGGFGLSGAIKGAMTAGALNAVSGVFHSIGDSSVERKYKRRCIVITI